MGATKYHINDAGETGICKASIKECKFGANGESTGTGVDGHYTSKEEATAAAEKFMENKYKEVYKGYRRGENEGMDLASPMKKRLIAEAQQGSVHVFPASIGRVLSKDKDELIRKTVAETLSSQKLLRDMSDDESARVRKAVALRTNNREVLAKLALDPDKSVQLAALQNSKTPVKARKAGQSAIREANIRNLAKAREKGTDTDPKAQTSVAVAAALENFKPFRNPEASREARAAIAEAHGVTVGKVKIHAATQQIGVATDEGVQVYSSKGERVGTVSTPIYEKMVNVQDQIERRRVSAKRSGKDFAGIRYSSTVWPAFRNAHDPEFKMLKNADGSYTESSKVGISRSKPDGYRGEISVSATDGNVYTYSTENLALISVKEKS